MPKKTIQIEIDYPDDCELVSHTREYTVGRSIMGNSVEWMVPIALEFQPAWQWPAWLKANWIAMDEMGQWHAYRNEPREAIAAWAYDGPRLLIEWWCDFTPPVCTDWRQSKRRRPS